MEIIEVSTKELKPYENNPRVNDISVDAVAESIKEFGFKVPCVITSDKVLITGHTRLKAAKKLGIKKIPCIMADDLSEGQIRAYRLADNKVGESSLWDDDLLNIELDSLEDLDMERFGFDLDIDEGYARRLEGNNDDDRDPSCQHNVFENQDFRQFPTTSFYGMPEMKATQTTGDKMLRFMDWKEIDDPENYIAHFYYDDYKFISAWREPEKYLERLKEFKAVVSPDFSVYTDFPRALQILACYRRQWCGAYWQSEGIDVIPDVVWGDKDSFDYCFDGIPKHSVVAVSTVGVRNDKTWNNKEGDLFKAGYDEMIKRLEPTKIIVYGSMIDGLEGDIINIPSYYQEKFGRKEDGKGNE